MRWQAGVLLWVFLGNASGFVIPINIEGVYANENVQVVELKVGTPCAVMRLAVDFSSKEVRLATSMAAWAERSSSFSLDLGGADVVRIGGELAVLPFTFGSAEAQELGCPTCQGVLGLGAESPMWIKFSGRATVTAGGTLVRESLRAFERELDSGIGQVKCLPGHQPLCVAKGTFKGYAPEVTVFFGFPIKRTQVPPDVFTAYVGSKNVEDNSAQAEWANLHITLPAEPGTGKDNRVRIRNVDLVTSAANGGIELMLESSEDPLVARISIQAWRSFMMRRHWSEQYMQVVGWPVRSHYSAIALTLPSIAALLLFFWKLADAGGWNAQSVYRKFPWRLYRKARGKGINAFFGDFDGERAKTHRTATGRYVNDRTERFLNNTRIVSEGLVAALVLTVAIIPTTRDALRSHEEVWILIIVIIAVMLFWGTLAVLIYFSLLPDLFGKLLVARSARKHEAGKKRRGPGLLEEPVAVLETALVPTGSIVYSLPEPTSRSMRYRSGNVLKKRAAFIGEGDKPPSKKRVVDEKSTYLHPRLWIVMGITHEAVIVLLIGLLLVEGRVETLGITSLMMVSMVLIGDLAFHLFYVWLIQTGPFLAWLWWLFIATVVAVLVAFAVVADQHIVQPWVERTIPNFPEMNFAWRFGIYVFVLWVAFGFSRRAAVDHEIRLIEAVRQH